MKKIFAATALAAVFYTLPASAIVIDDPLHGSCTGCVKTTIGGNNVTLIGPDGVTDFGFTISPQSQTGELQLKFLLPNNFTEAQINAFVTGVDVTGTNQPAGGTDLVLAAGQWTTGQLDTFLGFGATPTNPIGAFLDATQVFQPTATGYYVATADVGTFTLGGQDDPLTNHFALDPAFYAQGGLILANLFLANGDIVATNNSSALFFGGVNSGPFCATPPCGVVFEVPGPVAGAGALPVLALLGMWAIRRRRPEETV